MTTSDQVLGDCFAEYVAARLFCYFVAEQSGSVTVSNTTAEGDAWLRLQNTAGVGENLGNLTDRIAVGRSATAWVEAGRWYALMLLGSADGQVVSGTLAGGDDLSGIR